MQDRNVCRDKNVDITMIFRDAKYCVFTAKVLRLAKEIPRLAQDDGIEKYDPGSNTSTLAGFRA